MNYDITRYTRPPYNTNKKRLEEERSLIWHNHFFCFYTFDSEFYTIKCFFFMDCLIPNPKIFRRLLLRLFDGLEIGFMYVCVCERKWREETLENS